MFGVFTFTFTLTHFLAKNIFPEGMGVYKIHVVVEILEGWGGLVLVVKKWKVGEEGGLRLNSFHGGGMDIFCNYK